jgi:ArsR family transcriptional regulator
MKKNQKDNLLQLLKTLSDDTRLDIILLLATGEKCVCEIFEKLKLPQNLVSHHVGILRQNNLIINRKDGKWVYYSLNRNEIKKLQSVLEEISTKKEKISKC